MARNRKLDIDRIIDEMSHAFRLPPEMIYMDEGSMPDYTVHQFRTAEQQREWDRQNLPTGPMKAVTEFTVVKTERNKL